MRVKLSDRLTQKLLALPESGMGYQCVDVQLIDGRELHGVLVFNAEEVELPETPAPVAIADVRLHRQ